MTSIDVKTVPADPTSRDSLARRGLDYRVVSGDDIPDFVRAVHRGFLGPEPEQKVVDADASLYAENRLIGVYDPEAAQPYPVSTEMSWITSLSVPGGAAPMWAISEVTVAATHRRRGIARAMLEGELRAAVGAGLPFAGLTVSETTIYGRYGFAPAVPTATMTIDTRRAGWSAARPEARLLFVEREQLAEDLGILHERVHGVRAGNISGWEHRWRQQAGLTADAEKPRDIRGVRALDADGELVGAMAFVVKEGDEFAVNSLSVDLLIAATPDALAALWRFALTYDLVTTVTASRRPVDDPLPWLVADSRAIRQRVIDHGWLRILDVPAALRARSLNGALGLRLRVTDPLGIANGSWTVAKLGGAGLEIAELDEDARADVTLDVGALAAAYLGGVALETLADAGRVSGDPAKIAELSSALRTPRAPHLPIWY